MIQLPADEAEIAPGHAYRWRLSLPDPEALPSTRRTAGYNQAAHLAATRAAYAAGRPAPFALAIACGFELPGPLDLPALEAAFLHLVRRHEVLRTQCRHTARGVSVHVTPPDAASLERATAGRLPSRAAARTHLQQLLQMVDPVTGPLVVMGAVVREGSATVHVVYDHLMADLLSAPITVADLARAYDNFSRGREPDHSPADSYLDFAREERGHNLQLRADDERLRHWGDFAARAGRFAPAFPLDLGTTADRPHAPLNRTATLLSAPLAQQLDTACRKTGGTLFTGLLAAMAVAIRNAGGPDVYRALVPVNRRERHRFAHSIGWFANAVPVEITAPPGTTLTALIPQARTAFAAAREQADVHLVRAQQLLGHVHDPGAGYPSVSFLSYVDYRTAAGAEHPATRSAATHVWSPACNGTLTWFHRTHDGLHLNTLHADTPRARTAVDCLVRALAGNLRRLAGESRTSGSL
ncbi:condensation domain-containing protein [Streptomyces sp. NBC_01423]|uniref:condensation domain-containing protein n=1 Tax=Streptomyces sp. NBC_01423 TaxID=2903860 RepID=UPI002E2951B3|nr:condensation domain-containing protein [Streptomyces sp. NBC_01423]